VSRIDLKSNKLTVLAIVCITNPDSQTEDLRLTSLLANASFDAVPELDRQIADDIAQFFSGQSK
jgi:hypothetical protein